MQISDIHQFYTRNMEVHNMDDMDYIMSSISSSRAAPTQRMMASWRAAANAVLLWSIIMGFLLSPR